ncbi:hypothetical protein PHMEG_00025326 [Phytophthora megakarya]|uniref:Uncharacterized protein n=1 Tax=Phytophthora megakarya TaxID=4795 RepID=A0A225VCA3_9STRA|nr:hypothetical protein PHMEG_00025326 [Phytophthora megakarya]
MSREERKMAQIIASIERMEQETRASDDAKEPSDVAKRGKKGKRGRPSKKSKKFKVAVAVGAKAPFERKLTPKKRWIQLWSAQMDTKDASSSSEGLEDVETVDSSPEKAQRVTAAISVIEETPKISEASVMTIQTEETAAGSGSKEQKQTVVTPMATTTPKAAELRVKTPLNNESSHLSPPLERNSPTTTASISPSAKVKDSDTPNNTAAAAAAAKFSPAATEQDKPIVENEMLRKESAPQLERKSSSSSSVDKEDSRRDTMDHGKKRSLERSELPMSEEAKRRAERRRKRKSNWDVGDPRKGGSPISDPPVSAAAAAANQQSFAKYPPNRPPWRHSQSMMDIKPHFQSGHRSSSFYSNGPSPGGRRGFYHSTSLPQDRSRSAGRSSTRYSYGSSSSSYR